MRRLLGRFGAFAAVLLCVAMFAQTAAYAAPGGDVLVVVGGGSISPGLTLTPTFQSGTFSGTVTGGAAAAPGVAAGSGTCSFTFSSSIAETVVLGEGNAMGTCSGGTVGTASVTCTVAYVRVLGIVVIVILPGQCPLATVTGPTGAGTTTVLAGAGAFGFLPTTGNGVTSPITAYSLVGVTAGAGT